MIENTDSIVIPSNPEDQKKILDALKEMEASFLQSDSQKAQRSAIATRMKEELKIPKKVFNKMAKTFYKDNFKAQEEENSEFAAFYITIVKPKDVGQTN